MNTAATDVPVSYFGKLPTCGDFVKANNNHRVIALLDRWAGSGLELLSQDSGWKLIYDAAPFIRFGFLGSRTQTVIAGRFTPSRDVSGRRFPFMIAGDLEVGKPLPFIARSAMALSRLWAVSERHADAVVSGAAPDDALHALAGVSVAVNTDAAAYDAPYMDFLEIETVGSLQAMLGDAGHDVSVRNIVVALGDLMEQVMISGVTRLEKGLVLPLPAVGSLQNAVTTLWCDLLAAFLGRSPFELIMLIEGSRTPWLTVGFNGAHHHALCSVLDPRMREQCNVVLDDPCWVDELAAERHDLKKLVSYLDHGDLSLRTARDAFRKTFVGG